MKERTPINRKNLLIKYTEVLVQNGYSIHDCSFAKSKISVKEMLETVNEDSNNEFSLYILDKSKKK